jgi:hypothetical protein
MEVDGIDVTVATGDLDVGIVERFDQITEPAVFGNDIGIKED